MLKHLYLRDFAIVDTLNIDLNHGLTVLTGETGAGKSIVIDALGLILGDRAESGLVRQGCERTEISASFDLDSTPPAAIWLASNELDNDDECLLRRTISAEGRSRGWINGTPVTLQQLRSLGELLVDIHGQHEHQSLLKRDQQRMLLDNFASHEKPLTGVRDAYRKWQLLQDEREQLTHASQHADRLELLRFQVDELDNLDLHPEETQALDTEYKRLANADRLVEGCQQVMNILQGDVTSVTSALTQGINILETLQSNDPSLTTINELLNSAAIQIDEAHSELRHYLDGLSVDPQRLQEINERLGLIHDIARKHRINARELPGHQSELRKELDNLEYAEQRLLTLDAEIDTAAANYHTAARKLSKSRLKYARTLGEQVTATMQPLGMPGSQFVINIEPQEKFSVHGMDRIEFRVATNPKQPLKPLAKVASGGELSRISLAIQVITATDSRIPTLIFDEVDVGIGGGIAEIVGQKLRQLGATSQVLCVTHQPQVAAQGHIHLLINKSHQDESTNTQVELLNVEQRQHEIARMLGGLKITRQTLAHAQEMVQRANSSRDESLTV